MPTIKESFFRILDGTLHELDENLRVRRLILGFKRMRPRLVREWRGRAGDVTNFRPSCLNQAPPLLVVPAEPGEFARPAERREPLGTIAKTREGCTEFHDVFGPPVRS